MTDYLDWVVENYRATHVVRQTQTCRFGVEYQTTRRPTRAEAIRHLRKELEDVRADRIARDAEVARRIRGVNATPGSINSGYDKSHSIKDDPEHRRGGCCEAHSPGSTEWKAQQRTTEEDRP